MFASRTRFVGLLVVTLAGACLLAVACRPFHPQPPHPPYPPHPPRSTTTIGQVDCGIHYVASGWPTTSAASPGIFQCILDAFGTGTPAVFVEREQTDGNGGHILITTYEVMGANRVRKTVDATGAQPPGGLTVTTCSSISWHGESTLQSSGCV